MTYNDRNVIMEGVKIFKRNFKGEGDEFNREGSRNFLVYLDDDVAEKMARDGWNIKHFPARVSDDGEDLPEQAFMKIIVRFGDFPPQIFIKTSRNRTQIYEEDVKMLDTADIVNVDLIVNPSNYNRSGNAGVAAYLKSLYVTIEEDYLALKYANLDAVHNERIDKQLED